MTAQPDQQPPAPPVYLRATTGALRQGEILSDLTIHRLTLESVQARTDDRLLPVQQPLCLVVSQDCDLDQDFRKRSAGKLGDAAIIPFVLLCEVFEARQIRARITEARTWDRIKINKDERYHFLEAAAVANDALERGLPELAIDFKRYFTLPTDELYLRVEQGRAVRRCKLASPYLEHLSTRFSSYQCRVALPREHHSEPATS